MPILNPNNLPPTPTEKVAEIWRAQLEAAMGLSGKLNESVKIGVDAILKDAIEGKQLESAMPCIRIVYDASTYYMGTSSGSVLHQTIPFHLFFLYAVGKPGASVLPVDFTTARARHIRWNLEYLKDLAVLPNNTIGFTPQQKSDNNGNRLWWYPNGEQEITEEHSVPFNVLGVSIPIEAASGFQCSRLDITVCVNNHAAI